MDVETYDSTLLTESNFWAFPPQLDVRCFVGGIDLGGVFEGNSRGSEARG